MRRYSITFNYYTIPKTTLQRYILSSPVNCFCQLKNRAQQTQNPQEIKYLFSSINLHLVKYLRHGNPVSQVLNISARCSSVECLQLKQGKTLHFLLRRQNDRKSVTIFLFIFKAQAFSKMFLHLRQPKCFLNCTGFKPSQSSQFF